MKHTRLSLKALTLAALFLAVAIGFGPAAAEAQWIICWIYPDSTTDPYSDFCYGRGSGCADCIIIEYSRGGEGGGPGELPPVGAAAASGAAYRLGDQGANQPIGSASGTGLQRLGLDEAICREPRLDVPVQTTGSERVPAVRKDRLRTRRGRELELAR